MKREQIVFILAVALILSLACKAEIPPMDPPKPPTDAVPAVGRCPGSCERYEELGCDEYLGDSPHGPGMEGCIGTCEQLETGSFPYGVAYFDCVDRAQSCEAVEVCGDVSSE